MLTFEQARAIAVRFAGPGRGLMESAIQEFSCGWYFVAQTEAYLRTGDPAHMEIGSGGFVVDRESGRVHEFGSAYPLERNLRAYERGFRFEAYDLTVTSVRDLRMAARLLSKLRLKHVVPEEAHGVVWRIPKPYTVTELEGLLQRVPVTFRDCKLYFVIEAFDDIDRAGCFTYELREAAGD
jgi:hypothetical protein